MEEKNYILKIYRGTPGDQYWEEFELPRWEGETVICGLMEIQKSPVNRQGKRVEPVVWEQGCLEEVCGSCSMLVNGYPRQSCTALIENYIRDTGSNVVTLAPFTKFPLIRDLMIDRSQMFESLKEVHGWIETEGSREMGFGPLVSQGEQEVMYSLATCMTCGCCTEGCPQMNKKSEFVGPATISQARLFNAHPTGKMQRKDRLRPLMEEGGISECGNSQNCVEVCPKNIPLTDSIAVIGREVTLQSFRDLFTFSD
ncbi:MAG: Fumarate reductase iron-sulfur subunit [Chlamydiae bacterium]|nr:Fumarate reductase iron-sulfur subunit [Chlamydiota bacterium]